MSKLKYPGFDTLSLHGGLRPDPVTGARAAPIYQTTSFVFKETDQASSMFDLARSGHVYSRISNPTVAVLEERIAGLEGGTGAVATASGKVFSHLANVGDAKSLVIHPASTTHSRMDAGALKEAGITESLVRLSVGLEDPEDLINDLNRALYRSQR